TSTGPGSSRTSCKSPEGPIGRTSCRARLLRSSRWHDLVMTSLPFDDTADFEDADRGLIGSLVPCVVTTDDGRVIWDNDAYAFLEGDCPDTANPSLWRQGQLCAKQG